MRERCRKKKKERVGIDSQAKAAKRKLDTKSKYIESLNVQQPLHFSNAAQSLRQNLHSL